MDEDWSSPWLDADDDQQIEQERSTTTNKSTEITGSPVVAAATLTSTFNEGATPNSAVWGSFGESSTWGGLSKPAVPDIDDAFTEWGTRDGVSEVVDVPAKEPVKTKDEDVVGAVWGSYDAHNLAPAGYEQWSTLSTGSGWGDDNLDAGTVEQEGDERLHIDNISAPPTLSRPETPLEQPSEVVEQPESPSISPSLVTARETSKENDSWDLPIPSASPSPPPSEKLDHCIANLESAVPPELGLTVEKASSVHTDSSLEQGVEVDDAADAADAVDTAEAAENNKVDNINGIAEGEEVNDDLESPDDDFGDFAEEGFDDSAADDTAPFPTKPLSPAPITQDVPALSIETELVLKLYPIPISYPNPPPLEPEIISTIGARKAWYRLTKAETLRKSNNANDDDYVVVTWRNSKIKEEVNAIVSKWAPEDRVPRKNGNRASRSPGAMFGWGEGTKPASARSSTGTINNVLTHSPRINGPTEKKSVNKTPLATAASMVANFGWGSKSDESKSHVRNGSQSTRSTPRVSFDVQSQTRAPAPRSGTTSSSASIVNESRMSFHTVDSGIGHVSNKSSLASSLHQEPSKMEPPASLKQPLASDLDFSGWDAFENMSKTTTAVRGSSPGPVDEWSIFENLSSTKGTESVTNGHTVKQESLTTGLGDFDLFDSHKPAASSISTSVGPPSPAISVVEPSKINDGPIPKSLTNTSKLHDVSSISTTIPTKEYVAPLTPAVPSKIEQLATDDDEWGELVDTPSGFSEKESFSVPDTVKNRPTSSGGADKPTPFFTLTALNGLSRSNTLPSKTKEKLKNGEGTRAISSWDSPNSLDLGESVGSSVAPTASPSVSRNNGDEWDLSFFDAPVPPSLSSGKNSALPPAPASSFDLWDAPIPAQPEPKKVEPSDDDKIVSDIINNLPNLNYMLL
ncbi:hypothetical protein EDC01DRAFT_633068 [Geopyxis carbonaria]|nr:hypothetical protein EDC01DRAFT_633068 [Geopyxis carbonaria]